MNVVLIHNTSLPVTGYGGTERVFGWLAKGLKQLGHRVTLVCRHGSVFAEAHRVVPFDFAHFDFEKLPDGDIHHYFFIPPSVPHRPYLATIHGNGKTGEAFPPNSNFVSRNHALRHSSDCFVHNGIDPDEYRFSASKKAQLLFLAKASWRVKNVDGAIRIARRAGVPIHILGGTRWWRWPFGQDVWEGSVGGEKKAHALAESQGLLFPVLWHEPFGIAVVEALVSGTPVLATPFGSLPELVGERVGRLCSSEEEFIEAVPQLPTFAAKECRDWALSKFHYLSMAESYVKLYEKIGLGRKINQGEVKSTGNPGAPLEIPRRGK